MIQGPWKRLLDKASYGSSQGNKPSNEVKSGKCSTIETYGCQMNENDSESWHVK